MLSGPENMPKFGDGQLTSDEKTAIITFIQNNKATIDPGGYAARRVRPGTGGPDRLPGRHGRDRRGDVVDGIEGMSERRRIIDVACRSLARNEWRTDMAAIRICRSRTRPNGQDVPGGARRARHGAGRRRARRVRRALRPRLARRQAGRASGGQVVPARRRCSRCCSSSAFIWWPTEYAPRLLRRSAGPTRCTPRSSAPPWARPSCVFGIGVVALAKKIMPHEVAIQQRHIGMSDRGRPADAGRPGAGHRRQGRHQAPRHAEGLAAAGRRRARRGGRSSRSSAA